VEVTVPAGLTTGHFRSFQHITNAGDIKTAGTGEIRVSGAGYGCNIVSSGFEIRDLHRDAGGNLDRLDVLYVQHCEALEPALFGEVRLGLPPSRTLRTQPTAVRWPNALLTTPGTAAPVEVRNLARAAVDVTAVTLTGPGAPNYQIDRNGCRRQTITAAKSCLVLVRFHPLRAGPANASLVISTTAGTRRVPLDGTGLGGVTRLHMESDAGDWIGSGNTGQATTYTYTPRASIYYFRGPAWEEPPNDGLRVWIFASAYGPSWDIQFVAPPNQRLVPGTYVDDTPDWRSRPGLSITGYSRGCQDLQGTFTVHQIEYDRFTHAPIRFDVSFEQHCNGNTDALRGRLQYRTTAG
jgi:hypothetical protein